MKKRESWGAPLCRSNIMPSKPLLKTKMKWAGNACCTNVVIEQWMRGVLFAQLQ
jgi:hypothetical protein